MGLKKITVKKNKERGVAMVVALLALMVLAAIGVGFMFMADTENSVNNNYRGAQVAYFARDHLSRDLRRHRLLA